MACQLRLLNISIMGCVCVTISCLSCCLTRETERYVNESGFIGNSALLKSSLCKQRVTGEANMIVVLDTLAVHCTANKYLLEHYLYVAKLLKM